MDKPAESLTRKRQSEFVPIGAIFTRYTFIRKTHIHKNETQNPS